MQVVVDQLDGLCFTGTGDSNHRVIMDTSIMVGGHESGSSPKELFLMSLAGCAGMDVASILKKMKLNINKFKIIVESDLTDENPKIFKRIKLEYHFYGDRLETEKIEKAIDLSQNRYCGISAMIKKAVPIDTSYKIHSFDD